MPTATWTQDDVDTLKAAIGSGVLSVTYAGPPARTLVYQSLDAMRRLLADMVRDVAATAESSTTTSYRRVAFRKGFGSGD